MKKKTVKKVKTIKAVVKPAKKAPANTIYNTIHFVIWTGPDQAETFIDLHANVTDAVEYAKSLVEGGDNVLAITPNFNWKEGDGCDLLSA